MQAWLNRVWTQLHGPQYSVRRHADWSAPAEIEFLGHEAEVVDPLDVGIQHQHLEHSLVTIR